MSPFQGPGRNVEHADLSCEHCARVTRHELRYAGRLLESTRCLVCGTQLETSTRAMVPAYARDLEQRLVSKPGRMLRRAAKDPVGFAVGLPGAVVRQPGKLLRELWSLVKR